MAQLFGQVSLFDIFGEVDSKEDFIKKHLCRGSGFCDGKWRIKTYIERGERMSEFVKWLASEYGIGGYGGPDGESQQHDGKGIRLMRRSDNLEIRLSWSEVATRIRELVAKGIYYTEKDEADHQRHLQFRLRDVKTGNTWYMTEEQKQRALSGDLSVFENVHYLSGNEDVEEE